MIHVAHHHAVHSLNVVTSMVHLHVHVYRPTQEPHQTVVQSALLTQNVPVIKHALMRSVEILVQVLVGSMQIALLLIIHQFVLVQNMTQEIRSQTVTQNHLHVSAQVFHFFCSLSEDLSFN